MIEAFFIWLQEMSFEDAVIVTAALTAFCTTTIILALVGIVFCVAVWWSDRPSRIRLTTDAHDDPRTLGDFPRPPIKPKRRWPPQPDDGLA